MFRIVSYQGDETKPQWDMSIYLLECLQNKTKKQNPDNTNSHTLLVGLQNGIATLERTFTVSYRFALKKISVLTIWPSSLTS